MHSSPSKVSWTLLEAWAANSTTNWANQLTASTVCSKATLVPYLFGELILEVAISHILNFKSLYQRQTLLRSSTSWKPPLFGSGGMCVSMHLRQDGEHAERMQPDSWLNVFIRCNFSFDRFMKRFKQPHCNPNFQTNQFGPVYFDLGVYMEHFIVFSLLRYNEQNIRLHLNVI